MNKKYDRGGSVAMAIRNAFGHLGWHAKTRDDVAYLASFGIDVGHGLVERVRINRLKQLGKSAWRANKSTRWQLTCRRHVNRKLPRQRTYPR